MKIAIFCPHKLIHLLKKSLLLVHDDIVFVYEDSMEPLEGEYNFNHDKDGTYEFLELMSISLVIVYGWNYLIPHNVLSKVDFFNIHASPLPKYRGPYPVVFQLLHKEKAIGLTIHKMDSRYDSGDIFIKEYVDVDYNKLPYLEVAIFRAVKRNMIKLITAFLTNEISLNPQQEEEATYYSKKDLLAYLNRNTSYEEFVWMNEVFKIYKPFKVEINNNIYIVKDYSHTLKDGYSEFVLKDRSIYLKLMNEGSS